MGVCEWLTDIGYDMKLGVNIDHVASLRELRKAKTPDPVIAAGICEAAGAESIVVHLREDRRHIKDQDLSNLRKNIKTKLNLEMSISNEIVDIACSVLPNQATLVPEKRQELTTEGGLDVVKLSDQVKNAINKLHSKEIVVSLFIEADQKQIAQSKEVGAEYIEIHTGHYADVEGKEREAHLAKIKEAVAFAKSLGIGVNAGHGLDYENTEPICRIKGIEELNIGYSIVCRAVFVGLDKAVREMREIISKHSLN